MCDSCPPSLPITLATTAPTLWPGWELPTQRGGKLLAWVSLASFCHGNSKNTWSSQSPPRQRHAQTVQRFWSGVEIVCANSCVGFALLCSCSSVDPSCVVVGWRRQLFSNENVLKSEMKMYWNQKWKCIEIRNENVLKSEMKMYWNQKWKCIELVAACLLQTTAARVNKPQLRNTLSADYCSKSEQAPAKKHTLCRLLQQEWTSPS